MSVLNEPISTSTREMSFGNRRGQGPLFLNIETFILKHILYFPGARDKWK